MMLGARIALWSGKQLPYDAEVEWLESAGGSFLNLGDVSFGLQYEEGTYLSNYFMSLELDVLNQTTGDKKYSGCLNNDFALMFCCLGNKWRYLTKQSAWVNEPSFSSIGTHVIFEVDSYGMKIQNPNGTTLYERPGEQIRVALDQGDFYFFKQDTREGVINGIRFYNFSIGQSRNLILHKFKCVRVGQEGFVYDEKTGQLFRNQGTGAFILGPDKTT